MKLHHGIERFQPSPRGVVMTIGNFDGVHLGHRRLVNAARSAGHERCAPVVVMTFEPHPLAIVAPERAPARLTTLAEKLRLLEALGVDATIVLRSDRELLGQSAEEFLARLVERCRPRAIVEGPSFNFGRDRAGSIQTLRASSTRLGFDLTVVDEVHCDELAGNPEINSSAIRAALQDGRLADANAMLGRPYRITGTVGRGQQRGVTLGFPTANLDNVPQLLPRQAVYVAVAQLEDDSLHLAAVNIGPQPTFSQAHARIEAHLVDYSGTLRDRRLGVHLLARIRDQVRFSSADELVARLHQDIEETRGFAARLEALRAAPILPLE
jgi:riboflavin kinase/FMN adenylyltransferase